MGGSGHAVLPLALPEQTVSSGIVSLGKTSLPGVSMRSRVTFTAVDIYAFYFAPHHAFMVAAWSSHVDNPDGPPGWVICEGAIDGSASTRR
jgi:hypothetical protein